VGADEIAPAYRLMLAAGLAGLLILSIGALQFIHYEPLGQRSGLHVHIVGIYSYDPQAGDIQGGNLDHIRAGKPFAAKVDWSSLPAQTQAAGRWYLGGFALDVGGAGPAAAGSLPELVPVSAGKQKLPAGHISFVVERWSGGRAVEVLARKSIVVAGP
jgi:hypothetical protein